MEDGWPACNGGGIGCVPLDEVHLRGGDFLIHHGRYLSAKAAHEAKERFEKETLLAVEDQTFHARANASSAGWSLSDYMAELGLEHAEALPIDERLLRDDDLKAGFLNGFTRGVHSRYDEDEELFPGSERSIRLKDERDAFCRSFEADIEKKASHLKQGLDQMKEQIPYAERTYLAVPYEERQEAKALGARWDAVRKLLGDVEKKRNECHRQDQERFEATAARLSGELRSLSLSDVQNRRITTPKGLRLCLGRRYVMDICRYRATM